MRKLILILLLTLGFNQTPEEFEYNQSTLQAFYLFENVTIDGLSIASNDWVGTFNGDICVGSLKWDISMCVGGVCSAYAMGDDGSNYTNGYMEPGDIPTFKIYDTSENIYLNAVPSENFAWNNIGFFLIESLTALTPYYGCTQLDACNYNPDANQDDGSCEFPEENFDCDGNCLEYIDCFGICGGQNMWELCGCGAGDSCVGCMDPNACNYDPNATIDPSQTTEYEYLACTYQDDFECGCDENTQLHCRDLDGDGFGTNQFTFSTCNIEGDIWVLNCEDLDDTIYCESNEEDCEGVLCGEALLDCSNTCSGNAYFDECGNCDDNPNNDCIQDCTGTFGGDATIDCFGVCNGDAFIDFCGICGGDNTSCADCAGIPNGTNYLDQCGVCDNNPTNDCIQDCLGQWGGTAIIDSCGVCNGLGSIYECGCYDIPQGACDCYGNITQDYYADWDGDGFGNCDLVFPTCPSNIESWMSDTCGDCDNSNADAIQEDCFGICGGDAYEDQCGVCDNNSSNDCTQDCAGIWGGDAEFDQCGICGGDNSSCLDCAGIPNGTNYLDQCGTCDDDSSNNCTQDCLGIWGGEAYQDDCGICDIDPNNDNVSCSDCAGVPFGLAEIDCAGVCGGNALIDDCGICDGNIFLSDDYVSGYCNCSGDYWDACGNCGTQWGNEPGEACGEEEGCSYIYVDECGVCGGDNSTCTDCEGVLYGLAQVDQCGVCDEDTSNDCTQDCAGIWGGDAEFDQCGVCNGNNTSCISGISAFADPEIIITPGDSTFCSTITTTVYSFNGLPLTDINVSFSINDISQQYGYLNTSQDTTAALYPGGMPVATTDFCIWDDAPSIVEPIYVLINYSVFEQLADGEIAIDDNIIITLFPNDDFEEYIIITSEYNELPNIDLNGNAIFSTLVTAELTDSNGPIDNTLVQWRALKEDDSGDFIQIGSIDPYTFSNEIGVTSNTFSMGNDSGLAYIIATAPQFDVSDTTFINISPCPPNFTLNDESQTCFPNGFTYIPSTVQAGYIIESVEIDGVSISNEDWVGVFNGNTCVGATQWNTDNCLNGICSIVAYGNDFSANFDNYLLPGDIPNFKIYDSSENIYYDAFASENHPFYYQVIHVINTLEATTTPPPNIIDGCDLPLNTIGFVPKVGDEIYGQVIYNIDPANIYGIAGFLFNINNAEMIFNDGGEFNPNLPFYGGDATLEGLTIQANSNSPTILGMSLTGNVIQVSNNQLCGELINIAYENDFSSNSDEVFFTNIVFSDTSGNSIPVQFEDTCANGQYDCNGICGGDAYIDLCENCVEGLTGLNDCADGYIDCYGNIGIDADTDIALDCTGECGGTAVEDCAGICEGLSEYDECGICNGPGIPYDSCDCNGNTNFIDCGAIYDSYFVGDWVLNTEINYNYNFEYCYDYDVERNPDYINMFEDGSGIIAFNLSDEYGFECTENQDCIDMWGDYANVVYENQELVCNQDCILSFPVNWGYFEDTTELCFSTNLEFIDGPSEITFSCSDELEFYDDNNWSFEDKDGCGNTYADEAITGCTDENASNYDFNANWDNGSCYLEQIPGDLNNDSNIDIVDIVSLVNAVLAWTYNPFGDLNNDGTNDIVDVVLLVNLILY